MSKLGLTTRLLHADRLGGVEHGAAHKPLHTAVAYGYRSAGELAAVFQGDRPGYVYARQGNPTGAALEAKISLLEDARATVTFATGMAAIAAILTALLRAGDHLVSSQFLFGNTSSLLQTLQGLGVEVKPCRCDRRRGRAGGAARQHANGVRRDDRQPAHAGRRPGRHRRPVRAARTAFRRRQHADDPGALPAAHGAGRAGRAFPQQGHIRTWRQPGRRRLRHRPVRLDAPSRISWTATGRCEPALWGLQQIRKKGLRDFGGTLRAEDAHRIAVGAETLQLRVARSCANALALAQWLEGQAPVLRVYYPGLASHAQHERAAALFRGFGPLFSFELRTGIDPFVFLDALQVVILSSHLADNRTLAIPVAATIFHEMGPQRRAAMGIADGLIRVSAGIEDLDDLLADFAQALARAAAGAG